MRCGHSFEAEKHCLNHDEDFDKVQAMLKAVMEKEVKKNV
jgi:hypothetical protein